MPPFLVSGRGRVISLDIRWRHANRLTCAAAKRNGRARKGGVKPPLQGKPFATLRPAGERISCSCNHLREIRILDAHTGYPSIQR
jgi:hypothetical protein